MKYLLFIFFISFSLIAQNNPLYLDSNADIEDRLSDLMARMTLEEKVGQMCQYVGLAYLKKQKRNKRASGDVSKLNKDAFAMYGLSESEIIQEIIDGKIGSFLHVLDPEEVNYLQGFTLESRLKIPLIIGIDAIHGNAMVRGTTVYPSPISIAATFNNDFAYDVAKQSAREMRATGSQWTFMPNIDVARDPRWGRVGETFGEDPFMVGEMGKAMIMGFQGEDFSKPNNVIACAKHMIAGAEPLNGLNISPMDVSERSLYEIHLPPYKKAIDADVYSIMAAHNELNGIPSHMHKGLMTDLLRNEWGFDGFYVSDWYDIKRIWSYHKVARNYKEASLFSVEAGMDMNMHGPDFYDFIVALVKENKLSIDRVNQACSKILYAKFQLGLFENRLVDPSKIDKNVFIKSHLDKAEEIADNSITLLKNNNLLPINNSNAKRILVTGPNAHNHTTLGDWHFEQPEENVVTIFEGIQQVGENYNHKVDYFDSGIKIRNIQDSKIKATAEMSTNYDHVFVVVGDNSLRYTWEGGKSFQKTAGENKARSFLGLPGKQLDLVKSIYEKNKNLTVVYVSGKPISEPWIEDNIKSIIHAWEPGSMGGKSLGKIVFGETNPSGKMPMTTARSVGQLTMVYNHKPTNYIHKYAFEKTKPLYRFGFGLSYTSFSISEPTLSISKWDGTGKVNVEVDVKNTGKREGMETVQLYIRDLFSSVTRPVLELKGYKKINVAPGETKRVSFSLALDDFAFYDREMRYKAEEGDFNILVGNAANLSELKKTTLKLTKNIYINEN
ncbi:MAG: glycoside hydrolase family 3 N-terminal domain-containing protein [Flavobacteriaceae bacterium]|nr:glycoside hydrolase family 3 N-terminal domain-containing protein [Flavobacteriaceae bacterium]